MTVEVQPVAELPDPAQFGFTVVPESDMPVELTALVDQVRGLVDAVAHTEAGPAELAQAQEAVAELTERLNRRRRPLGAMVKRESTGNTGYSTIANIVSGPTNAVAPPLDLRQTPEGVAAEVTLSGTYEGPPGLVHGGWIAAMLDQALGEAAAAAGTPGMTANLDVNYREPTPLNAALTVTARITGAERRKVFVSGEVYDGATLTAEATAIMVQILPVG